MTSSRRWWLIAPLALAAGVAAYAGRTVIVRGNDADAARLRALEARLALLEGRARTPGANHERVITGDQHLVVPVAPVEADDDSPAAAAAPSAPRPREDKGPAVDEGDVQRAYFGELDARLASETRDPVWAAPTEEMLRGSTLDLRPRITIDAAQCGQTMCRVETSVADPEESIRAMEKFLHATVATLPEAVVRDGDQPGRHIVYFARKGGEFPPMVAEPETATP